VKSFLQAQDIARAIGSLAYWKGAAKRAKKGNAEHRKLVSNSIRFWRKFLR